ncbi:hypothetical protein [Streptomyces sp. NPDC050121]|uniref:hypothetical protein n=1 Tax=Streptomyces sp. NPDC050121 TaxID=3365601 RepID=UPI00379A78D9
MGGMGGDRRPNGTRGGPGANSGEVLSGSGERPGNVPAPVEQQQLDGGRDDGGSGTKNQDGSTWLVAVAADQTASSGRTRRRAGRR